MTTPIKCPSEAKPKNLAFELFGVHSPQLAVSLQRPIRNPSFPHVGADPRVRPSEEGAHTGAPLRHYPAAVAVMSGSDTPLLAAGFFI